MAGKICWQTTLLFVAAVACLAAGPAWSVFAQTAPATTSTAASSASTTAASLQSQIDQKNSELQQIQAQRDALQAQLNQISQSKNSLSKEVQTLNNGISNLDLQLKQNQVAIQKLTLQMQSDSQDITTIQQEIQDHHAALAKLMVEIQQQGDPNLISLILKSGNLSDSVSAAQDAELLNEAFLQNISALQDLQSSLSNKVQDASSLKVQKQQQQTNLSNQQSILADQKSAKQGLLDQTKGQETVYQQQIAKLDEQQSAISQEIGRIEDQLRASFNPDLLPSKLPGLLSFPVADPIITQLYGETQFAKKAYSNHFHNGVDIGVPIGTPVYAAADGTVFHVDNNDRGTSRWLKYQFGKYIMIDHGDNLTTMYAHLSRQVVTEGEKVKRGQLIGYSGETGYADGPHVHFGLYWTPSIQLKKIPPAAGLVPVGVTIDPMEYLPQGVATIQRGAY